MKIITCICLAIIICIVTLLTWKAIDESTVKSGIVIKKYYTPVHYTTTYVMAGKVLIPISIFHNENWIIVISGKDYRKQLIECELNYSKEEYDKIKIGENIFR